MSGPGVSVVVPLRDAAADLPGLLDALFALEQPPGRAELVLVDNGSRDGTPALLSRAVGRADREGWPLRVVSAPERPGSYAARNAGIRAARAQLLAFTDADCRPRPDWLRELVRALAEDAGLGLVAGAVEALPGESLLEAFAARHGFLSQETALTHPHAPFGQTANLGARRLAFERAGLFRPALPTGGDAELCWRIQARTGLRLGAAPRAVVLHRHRRDLASLWRQWRRYGASAALLEQLDGPRARPLQGRGAQLGMLWRWLARDLARGLRAREPLLVADKPLRALVASAHRSGLRRARLPAGSAEIPPLAPLDPS